MNYIDGFIEAFPPMFDEQESQDEAAASHQMALDALHRIGCQYNIATPDMALLCQMAQINFNELNNHSYKLKESTTPCQSQQCYSVNQAPAKPQACAI